MLECARNNTVRDVSHCGGGALRRYKRLIGVEEVMAIRRAALPMATVSKVVLAASDGRHVVEEAGTGAAAGVGRRGDCMETRTGARCSGCA